MVSSLLSFISISLFSIPFVFFYKGKAIRLRSPWVRDQLDQSGSNPALAVLQDRESGMNVEGNQDTGVR